MKRIRVILLSLLMVFGMSVSTAAAEKNVTVNDTQYEVSPAAGLIDLHLHLDGSLSLASVRELAEMQEIEIPESDEELLATLQVNEDCKDLNEYLEKFDFPLSLLQTEAAISTAVYNLEEELKKQGLIYAEIRFAPQLHTEKGLSQAEVIEAAITGTKKSGFHSNLILCCMRGSDNHEENLDTVRLAKEYLGQGVCGVDIAGAEALFPTDGFEDIFTLAKKLNVPFTIHAGEADGPQSVYKALEFGAERIGHGVRSIEDENLVSRLAREKIALELCPTSNLNTNIFESIEEYPLRKLMEAGVKVTINTDNMTVSGITLQSEFQKVTDACSLTGEEIETIVRNAADASFAAPEEKAWINAEIDKRFRS